MYKGIGVVVVILVLVVVVWKNRDVFSLLLAAMYGERENEEDEHE